MKNKELLKSVFLNAGLLILSVVSVFVIFEVVLRFIEFGPSLTYDQVNSHGLRDSDYGKKPIDVVRIMVVGDSFTKNSI